MPATRYPYRDAAGCLLYTVVRHDPKQFEILDARGRAVDPFPAVAVLYRLPELNAADPTDPVFVCEGEKDADRVRGLGLVATSNLGAAGSGGRTSTPPAWPGGRA